jgi:hypothetical protein
MTGRGKVINPSALRILTCASGPFTKEMDPYPLVRYALIRNCPDYPAQWWGDRAVSASLGACWNCRLRQLTLLSNFLKDLLELGVVVQTAEIRIAGRPVKAGKTHIFGPFEQIQCLGFLLK